jgi:CHAD domain-containing protein
MDKANGKGRSVESSSPSGYSDHVEKEWQYSASSLDPVQAWLTDHCPELGFHLSVPYDRELTDSYFETEAWDFYRAGLKLRLRRRDDGKIKATLKSLARGGHDLQCRREISQILATSDLEILRVMEGPLGERMKCLSGVRPIRRLFQVYTQRRGFKLTKSGDLIAEIALDRSMISRPEQSDPELKYFVEFEGENVTQDAIAELIRDLRRDCQLQPCLKSKFETGLQVNDLVPVEPLDPGLVFVERGMAIGDFVWSTLRRHFLEFAARESGTRLGEDIEELHQMRVSSRRMRTALKIFRKYLPARAESFNRTLRWVAKALGDERDMDIKMEQINHWRLEAIKEDQHSFAHVMKIFKQDHTRCRKRVLDVLDSRRYQHFLKSFEAFLLQGPSSRPLLWVPAAEVLPDMLGCVHAKVIKAGKRVRKNPVPENYHLLRIACKKQRYFLEFVAELCGSTVKPFRKQLIKLQDVLGCFNDAVVGTANIRQLVLDEGRRMPPVALFTLGRMAERYQAQAGRSLEKVPKLFRLFQEYPWKKLRKSLS